MKTDHGRVSNSNLTVYSVHWMKFKRLKQTIMNGNRLLKGKGAGKVSETIKGKGAGKVSETIKGKGAGKVSETIKGKGAGKVSETIKGKGAGKVSETIKGKGAGKVSETIKGKGAGKVSETIKGKGAGKVSETIKGKGAGKVSETIKGKGAGKVSETIKGKGAGKVSETIKGKGAGKVSETIKRQLSVVNFFNLESESDLMENIKKAPLTHSGCESQFADVDNDMKRAGGSTSLKTISNKTIISKYKLFEKSRWHSLSPIEKQTKLKWARGSQQTKNAKQLEEEVNKKVKAANELSVKAKREKKLQKKNKTFRNLEEWWTIDS